LQVGIGLQVTPYINPDGLVVMQIDETIDELAGTTTIANVGEVPNTTSRRLSAEVAVRDGDSVMLGGFIRNSTEKKSSGIPILKDIPLLGILFSTRSSTKDRKELIVLMRPTVLKTPEIAASATAQEKKHLPGVSSAEAEVRIEEKLELDREGKSTRAMEKRLQKLEKNSQSSTNSWVPWY
jgi:general secretion pathway protein D